MNAHADLRLDNALRTSKANIFKSRAKLYPSDYAGIIEPFVKADYEIVRLRDVFERTDLHGKPTLFLRHDVDHDYETALRIGEWEAERGFRSTYCMLHTAWYYGEFDRDHYVHSAEFIDCCVALQEMGHEINLHNNLVAFGLQNPGVDLAALLKTEVEALRGHGIELVGTSAHGDALCGKHDFINLELFKGRAWDQKGGPRRISTEDSHVDLGSLDGDALGIKYEAYDFPRDIYISDSGGRPRMIRGTRGLRGLRKSELEEQGVPTPFPSLCGILTHPIWWDFSESAVPAGSGLFRKAFRQHGFSTEVLMGDTPHVASPVVRHEWPAGGDVTGFQAPNKYAQSRDEVIYRAPVEINRRRLKQIILDKAHFETIGAALSAYVLKNEDEMQAALFHEFINAPSNEALLIEAAVRNGSRLLDAKNWRDVAYLAVSLRIAADRTGSAEFSPELDRLAKGLIGGDVLDSVSADTQTLCLLAFAFPSVGAAADSPAAKLAAILTERLSGLQPDGLPARADLYALGAALARAGDNDPRLAAVATHVTDDLNSARKAGRWTDGAGGVLSLRDSVSLALFLYAANGREALTDDQVRAAANLVASLAFGDEAPRAGLSSDAVAITDQPEAEAGYGPSLAWSLLAPVSEDLSACLNETLMAQDFADWFRSPVATIGYAARFAAA